MEIVAKPRRRRPGRLLARSLAALALLLVVLLLTPAALGLERHVVGDDAMVGSLPRGSLVFTDRVPASELRVGDVITFPSPADPHRLVTRRIVGLSEGLAVTQGDARATADPWSLRLDDGSARVAVSIPWLGHPWLLLAGAGTAAWLLVAAGVGVIVLGWRVLGGRARSLSRAAAAAAFEGGRAPDAPATLR